jgi:hypothetical protein
MLQQFSGIPCPTCGVAAGKSCLLYSGEKRNGPHTARKLLAFEVRENAVRRKRGSGELSLRSDRKVMIARWLPWGHGT